MTSESFGLFIAVNAMLYIFIWDRTYKYDCVHEQWILRVSEYLPWASIACRASAFTPCTDRTRFDEPNIRRNGKISARSKVYSWKDNAFMVRMCCVDTVTLTVHIFVSTFSSLFVIIKLHLIRYVTRTKCLDYTKHTFLVNSIAYNDHNYYHHYIMNGVNSHSVWLKSAKSAIDHHYL